MKIVKPLKAAVYHRTFEHGGGIHFVVSVALGFPFAAPKSVITEPELWLLASEELGAEGGLLDEGYAKPAAEVLVNGACFPPGGAAPLSFVRLEAGTVDKRLAVFGDRRFRLGVPTEPTPFTNMPVDWAHAFGAPTYPANPLGKGAAAIESQEGKVQPLPNVELEDQLIVGPSDKPPPAGLGAIDRAWPQRTSLAGTYDASWLETRFPGFADDLDPAMFFSAARDQRLDRFLQGGDVFAVTNMHPSKPVVRGALPDAVVRVFVTQRGHAPLREVATRVDTLRLFPGRELAIAIHRAVIAVAEDDAADVELLVAAVEDPAAPRSIEHYERAIERRLHKEYGAIYALADEDLMPPKELGWTPRRARSETDAMIAAKGLRAKNARQRLADQVAKNRAHLVEKGLDPAAFGLDGFGAEEPAVDVESADSVVQEIERTQVRLAKQQEDNAEKRAKAEADMRAKLASRGMDFDAELAKAKAESAGPPKFSARKQLEWMASMAKIARDAQQPDFELEARIADPKTRTQFESHEKGLIDAYRRGAHLGGPAPAASVETSERARAELGLLRDNGLPAAGRDLTGVDLSGMNLAGLDLHGAFLESAVLSKADLSGANLEGAVLAHARLDRTKLTGAKLSRANLGGATIDDADLSEVELDDAVLARAKIREASFARARIARLDVEGATWLAPPNFEGARLEQVVFSRLDMAKARFAGAHLVRVTFLEPDLEGADFSDAELEMTSFVKGRAPRASFRGAKFRRCSFADGCSLVEADFSRAALPRLSLRALDLTGAVFRGAKMNLADLSESTLVGADLSKIVARDAMFVRSDLTRATLAHADLFGAVLQKATLAGADLTGSSLFRADLARVVVDGKTRLDGANTTEARQLPRAQHGPR